MNDFVAHILNILKTNGFPLKRVSLPTEKMYEAADNKGLSFNAVLDVLKKDHQVEAQIGTEKIIFSLSIPSTNQSKEDMMKQAQEMMGKMTPEEMKRMQDLFMNMSPEEKAELMKKGKELGLI